MTKTILLVFLRHGVVTTDAECR